MFNNDTMRVRHMQESHVFSSFYRDVSRVWSSKLAIFQRSHSIAR